MWPFQNKNRVIVKILADDKEQNLNYYTDYHLYELVQAINTLIKRPPDSILQYEAEVYVHHRCFKEPQHIIEIVCYKKQLGDLHRIALPLSWRSHFVGREENLHPQRSHVRTWPARLHAHFLAV